MKSRHLVILILAVVAAAVFPRPVRAHASLLGSLPEANARLDRPPAQIELFFSEAIDNTFSVIEVLDGGGKRVDNDDAQVDLFEPTRMTVSLRSLPDGIYIVSWRTLSAVDSHITAGAFPFAIGDVDAAALEAAAQAGSQIQLSPGEILARWLTFLSAMVLVGGMFFMLVVWRPAASISGLESQLRLPFRRLATIALLALLAANIFWLLLQAGQVAGRKFASPWDPNLNQVLYSTRFGALWLLRFTLALTLIWLLPKIEERNRGWLAFATGATLLLSISLGSHAAAQPAPLLPIVSDWIHLVAASLWVGGLVTFLVGLRSNRSLQSRDRTRLAAALIPRFSAMALMGVSVLALTGLYASILEVGSFANLTGTIYGRTLMFKLALLLPMIALGGINLLFTSPRMKRAAGADSGATDGGAADGGGGYRLVRRFRRLVTSEISLGVAVLLSVGLLTTLSPSRVAVSESMLIGEQEVDDLEIGLEISPGRPGLNKFQVTLASGSRPLLAVREVSLQFTPTTVELPPSSVPLIDQGEGVYGIEGGFLALPDAWQVQVAVRRLDAFDAFANFDFDLGSSSGSPASQGFPWRPVAGITLLVASLLYWLALPTLVHGFGGRVIVGQVPAILLGMVGLLVFLNPAAKDPSLLINPIAPNADSIATGAPLYQQNCLPCHGPTGAGDGPVGLTLNPRPADLTLHTQPGVHPDGRLFGWITNGIPDSVMPGFEERMSDEERWHLVNYIRTLAQ